MCLTGESHFVNENRHKFSEYLLVLDPAFLSPKEHNKSSRDRIEGVKPLVVDILIIL